MSFPEILRFSSFSATLKHFVREERFKLNDKRLKSRSLVSFAMIYPQYALIDAQSPSKRQKVTSVRIIVRSKICKSDCRLRQRGGWSLGLRKDRRKTISFALSIDLSGIDAPVLAFRDNKFLRIESSAVLSRESVIEQLAAYFRVNYSIFLRVSSY